jgi:hypothetical protein
VAVVAGSTVLQLDSRSSSTRAHAQVLEPREQRSKGDSPKVNHQIEHYQSHVGDEYHHGEREVEVDEEVLRPQQHGQRALQGHPVVVEIHGRCV